MSNPGQGNYYAIYNACPGRQYTEYGGDHFAEGGNISPYIAILAYGALAYGRYIAHIARRSLYPTPDAIAWKLGIGFPEVRIVIGNWDF